jgi:hypothetical protein
MSTVEELLRPFISEQFGSPVRDPEARLIELKRLVPGELPADYEDFLRRFGRAVGLEENHILAIDPPHPRQEGVFTYIGPNPPIDTLYGLQEGHSSVFEALDVYSSLIPPGLIAIGCDLFGNQICMDVSGRGPSTVWHWFHEGELSFDWDGNAGYANMFRLAESFTDLLQRLRHGSGEDPTTERSESSEVSGTICKVSPEFEEALRKWREERSAEENGNDDPDKAKSGPSGSAGAARTPRIGRL